MSVKTHIRPKRVRHSVMESLGFTETPSVSYVSAPSATPPKPQSTRLVSTVTTRAITVEEIWNTTELETQSLMDWEPGEISTQHLGKRVHWMMLVIWFLILAVVSVGGFWIYQNSLNEAAGAMKSVEKDANVLDSAFAPFLAAAEELMPGADEIPIALNEATASVDAAARELFASSASLSQSESEQKSAATDAATRALDASKTLNTLSAYLGALTPVMTSPALITDPEMVDLVTATTDFAEWRTRLDTVRSALPDSILSEVSANLDRIDGHLERIQGAYLNALRLDDPAAALKAVGELEDLVATTLELAATETDLVKAEIVDQIGAAEESLQLLIR